MLARVVHRDRDDLVPRGEPAQRAIPSFGDEVGEHHDDAAVPEQPAGVGETGREVGAAARGLERDQVADHPQRVTPSLPRRNHPLHLVREEQRAHPVVVIRRGEGEDRGDLHREPALLTGSPNRVEPD